MLAAALLSCLLAPPKANEGRLVALRPDGKPGTVCALKHTAVEADIDGFGAAVTVTQTFTNPSRTPVEAVYTFPLPQDAAVDQMRIQVGERIIEGEIARRDEARRTYEAAKAAGQAAALLDQERPNVFTQSIANLMPGAEIRVQIRYVQVLDFTDGRYEFSFPMTVGPRYVDGNTPDPEKVTPPIAPKGTRTGATIDLTVNLDAGAPIKEITSVLHATETRQLGGGRVQVRLARKDEIPNRDFILRYRAAEGAVQSSFVSNFDPKRGGTFAMVLMPPPAVPAAQVAPKEMVFVMDQSGSQSGFPIEKSKELTLRLVRQMGPRDTFNVLGFSNEVNPLWPTARANTAANVAAAERFVRGLQANGGTQLEKAVVHALGAPDDPERLRVVVFNTDGFAGQEDLILESVRKHRGKSRLFAFGIGNSVNRYLIDAMAVEGRGDMEVVTLAEQADAAVGRLYRRAKSPVLTDVSVAMADGIEVTPKVLPDVFLERPVVVLGRYARPGKSRLTVRGTRADGTPWSQTMDVTLTDQPAAPAIASLWARRRVDDLIRESRYAPKPLADEVEDRVTALALQYRIMSAYTSFVAVEKRVVNVGGRQRTVRVPIEMADGVSHETTLGVQAYSRGLSNSVGGLAGGGFGAGSPGAPAPTRAKQRQAVTKLESLDASEKPSYESKVSVTLRKAKGNVEVQVMISTWSDAVIAALEKAGLKIDAKEKDLKVVFGTIDAKALKALAEIAEVTKVSPVE